MIRKPCQRSHFRSGAGIALPFFAVLSASANLRAPISSVGPMLTDIGVDVGAAPWLLGVVTALPIAAFAVCSPFGPWLARRFGANRVVIAGLCSLGCGVLCRSLPAHDRGDIVFLLVGTLIIGGAIALGNVLLPVVVREVFPTAVPRVTGYYIAVQSIVAGVASGFVVPVAHFAGGWRIGLALSGVLLVIALPVWMKYNARETSIQHNTNTTADESRDADETSESQIKAGIEVRLRRSGVAWQVAIYFGMQSSAFYILLTWLPTIEQDIGVSDVRAGLHLAIFLLTGIVANLVAPRLLGVGGDQRVIMVAAPVSIALAVLGIYTLPAILPLWVALAGLGTGASMVLSLSLISMRSSNPGIASRLSGMAQSSAYSVTVVTLLFAGALRNFIGHGTELLMLVLLVVIAQTAVGIVVGKDRKIQMPYAGRD